MKKPVSVLVFASWMVSCLASLSTGRTFALLTARPFDVLLQSLPFVSFRLLPSPPLPLHPSLPSASHGLLCRVCSEIYTYAVTHTAVRDTAGKASMFFAVCLTISIISLVFPCTSFISLRHHVALLFASYDFKGIL